MKSTQVLFVLAAITAGVFAGCSIDVKSDKDKCIGISCNSSDQCISGNCIGVKAFNIFKCGGCNDNSNATTFKCPGNFCNENSECATTFCNKTVPANVTYNGTCAGEILEYKGLKQW